MVDTEQNTNPKLGAHQCNVKRNGMALILTRIVAAKQGNAISTLHGIIGKLKAEVFFLRTVLHSKLEAILATQYALQQEVRALQKPRHVPEEDDTLETIDELEEETEAAMELQHGEMEE
ncbi:hypothetical protein DFH06DRAFT_1149534 [Mycena polygramma]|nr:hypothetical protein DFH06DRAFT_1149534 [Mycena polygramma]